MFHVGGQPDSCHFLSRVPPSPSTAEEGRHVFVPEPQLEGTFLPLRRCTSLACGEGYNRRCDRLWKRIVSSVADQGSQEQSKAVDGCVTHPDTKDNTQSDGTDSSRVATPCSYSDCLGSDCSDSDCSCSDCDLDSDCDYKCFAPAHHLIIKSLLRFDGTVVTEQDNTEGQSQSPQRSAQTAPEDHNGTDVTATVDK